MLNLMVTPNFISWHYSEFEIYQMSSVEVELEQVHKTLAFKKCSRLDEYISIN